MSHVFKIQYVIVKSHISKTTASSVFKIKKMYLNINLQKRVKKTEMKKFEGSSDA